MKLRWTFRCYPTPGQAQHLARTFGCTRFVYNWALAERTAAWKDGGRMGYPETDRALTALKKQDDRAWLNEVSSVPLQQALRHLQTAFVGFFEKRTGYPTFKKKTGRQSATYTHSAFRFELDNQQLFLAKIGAIKIKWSRHVPVMPSTVTVIRTASGKFFVSMVIDVDPTRLPETGQVIGIDFGVARLATLSTGERIANPRYLARYQAKIARLSRDLARKQKGSNRRFQARRKLAAAHEKVWNCRKDVQNKLAWNLVSRYDTIYVEDLNLRGMVKNHNLARSLSDAAIGAALRAIETKAAMHGKTVVKIDRFFPSSKLCSACGVIRKELKLSERQWTCLCGAVHDRDENAAKNIVAVGQTVTAHGDGVRAVRTTVRKAGRRGSANHLGSPDLGNHRALAR